MSDSLTIKIPEVLELSATGQWAIAALLLILAAYAGGKRLKWW